MSRMPMSLSLLMFAAVSWVFPSTAQAGEDAEAAIDAIGTAKIIWRGQYERWLQDLPRDYPFTAGAFARHYDEAELVRRMAATLDAAMTAEEIAALREFTDSDAGRALWAAMGAAEPGDGPLPDKIRWPLAEFERSTGLWSRYLAQTTPMAEAATLYFGELFCITAIREAPERLEELVGQDCAAELAREREAGASHP